nr:WPP domain-interacting protein 2-like [Tanacetum cinerariifolium]
VQKWKDVGKDDPSIFDYPILNMLERKDAKILELESILTSPDTETEFEDYLKKRIQVEVEYIVISTKTETLTSELLREIRHNVQLKNALSQDFQPPKKQAVKSETLEDVKKMQNMIGRSTSFLMIQLILLLITLYLEFAPQDAEIVPT